MNNRERKFVYKLAGYDNGVYMIELEETIDRLKRRNKKLKQEIARLNKIIDEIEKIVFDKNLYETEYEGIYKCIKGELCNRYYLLTELRKKIRKLKKELKEEGKSPEIPLFEGTMEQLDNLTILKEEGK